MDDRVVAEDALLGEREGLPGPVQRLGRFAQADRGTDRALEAAQAAVEHVPASRAVGVRCDQDRRRAVEILQHLGGQRGHRATRRLAPGQHDHGQLARLAPLGQPGSSRRWPQRRPGGSASSRPASLRRRRCSSPATWAWAWAYPVGGQCRYLVQENEEGLGEQAKGLQRGVHPLRRAGQPAQRDPGPGPQGRLERLKAAALAGLGRAQPAEHLGRLVEGRAGVGDPGDELAGRLLGATADRVLVGAVRPAARTRPRWRGSRRPSPRPPWAARGGAGRPPRPGWRPRGPPRGPAGPCPWRWPCRSGGSPRSWRAVPLARAEPFTWGGGAAQAGGSYRCPSARLALCPAAGSDTATILILAVPEPQRGVSGPATRR